MTTSSPSVEDRVDDEKARPDPAWRGMYAAGGLAMAVAGLAVLVATPLGYRLGASPGDSVDYLLALAAQPTVANATYSLWSLYAILLFPASLGLYLALKGIDRTMALIGSALVGFFITLDLGVTEFNALALVRLAQSQAAATSDAQREVYLAAAHWGLATLPVATFFSWLGPSTGLLILSVVMLKGSLGRSVPRVGIVVNGVGILAAFYFVLPLPFLAITLTPTLLVYGAWLIATGRRLYALRQTPSID